MSAASLPITRYQVTVHAPHHHVWQIEAVFPALPPGDAVARLPAWSPGSYLIREYARNLQDLTADVDGEPASVVKLDKASWRISLPRGGALRLRYGVYAHELTVRTSHLDGTHGFLHGPALFLYVDERRAAPVELALELPDTWRATCALPPGAEPEPGRYSFRAADYDELVDSPVECGTHELLGFEAADPASGSLRPHCIAVWGRVLFDRDRLVADVAKIVDTAARLFGDLPYDRYCFLLMLAQGGRGGLEHRASCALLASPFSFSGKAYADVLELFSHEFFHLWNVKRIHPEALGPFDYTREAYTRSLWVMEGVTSYYDRLLVRRAGLIGAARYLEQLGEDWGKLLQTPGRVRQSVEESSFDAWIKLYRPDENTVNTTVSYYLKGSFAALALDLAIRARGKGARSLDDVMRHLWRRYGRSGVGFRDEEVQREFEAAVDMPLGDLFDSFVRGREDPDLGALLVPFGLELKAVLERDGVAADGTANGKGETAPVWLGVTTRLDGGRTLVSGTLEGGPARTAGLYPGDELLAIDGFRVDDRTVKERLAGREPGAIVRVTVFRRDELVDVEVTLAPRPPEKWQIVPRKDASPADRARYEDWLGEKLP